MWTSRACLLATLTLGAALLAAQPASATDPGRNGLPLPTSGETPLLGGQYGTKRFRVPFSFSVRDRAEWRIEHVARQELFLMRGSVCCAQNAGDQTGGLLFISPQRVIDARTGKPRDVAHDLAGWLRHNGHVRVGAVTRARVGGRSGREFLVRFRSPTPDNPDCANLVVVSFGPFGLCPGDRWRVTVLRVDGRPLMIVSAATPAGALAHFASGTRALLATVVFGRRRVGATPRVLIIGNSDPPNDDELFFARDAARRSSGSLQISLRSELYEGTPDAEERVARNLMTGQIPLAWDATRVWDTQGVTTFQGLQAPFLINTAALMGRVVASPLAAEAASGLRAKGVVGLGLAAINLRRPLGAKKPFASLTAFNGAKVNVIPSKLSDDVVRALGATPLSVGGGDALAKALKTGKVDAAETAIDVVYRNGYADVAKYIASNVVLFPKFASIDANEAALARLSANQRAALAAAAAATGPRSAARLGTLENADAAALCKQGIRFATATQADLGALAASEQPVYGALSGDAVTAHIVAELQALKVQVGPGGDLAVPAGCGT